MGRMPILAQNRDCSGGDQQRRRGCYRIARPLPVFYMADYSVLGLLVDKLEEAVRVLGENKFSVSEENNDIEVSIDHPTQLQGIVQLLTENGVGCELADVVSGIYQG
jgi:hypothetical protein